MAFSEVTVMSTIRVNDFNLSHFLKLAEKSATACEGCKSCFCKGKGKLPVSAAINVLQNLRNTQKIKTAEQFTHFSKVLKEDISTECQSRYMKEIQNLEAELFPKTENIATAEAFGVVVKRNE